MGPDTTQAAAQAQAEPKKFDRRRGVVIVAVLVIVAALSLAGYHFTDMMTSEDKAATYAHRNVQARLFADSGIHYTAAILSDPTGIPTKLGGNPWNNPDMFKDQVILLGGPDSKVKGFFSIIGPATGDANVSYGVSDEGSKINLNAIMKQEPTGQVLHDMLVKLPGMTEEVANNIVAWMGGQVGIQNGGMVDYSGAKPPYRCRFGPIDSIDELLLVQGVTPDLLYGTDKVNRNGIDDDGDKGGSAFNRGWSTFLTVHSREQNCAPDGSPYIYLNNTNLKELYDQLVPEVGDEMAKFIVMCRKKNWKTGVPDPTKLDSLTNYTVDTTANVGGTDYKFKTLFDLVGTYVSIPKAEGKKTITKHYMSPLSDVKTAGEILTKLFAKATLKEEPEIPARININTAPKEVLSTLVEITNLTDNDIEKIVSVRAGLTPEALRNPTWLLTEATIEIAKLRGAPGAELAKYLTTVTQVYRVQSVGYFEDKGPFYRIEAVIDTNAGRPRILAWRDLSELGKGLP